MQNKINNFIGIEYGRGCLRVARDGGCADAPAAIRQIFPDADWTMVTAAPFDADACVRDRFGENFEIQREIYRSTPNGRHILIGGDHSVNFGHFAAMADMMPDDDLCLVYIDSHLDIHSVETAVTQASGAPHGTNVRALLGNGDARWMGLCRKRPALKPENLFFLGARSYESAEIEFVQKNNIFMRSAEQISTDVGRNDAIRKIRERIAGRPFVLSFDFDVIDPALFRDVLVPAPNGIDVVTAEFFINEFRDAHAFEFVEYAPAGDKNSAEIVRKLIGFLSS
ncbi:MAG: arginase family protein [Alphaproteobacteria bacterium]|nr:arginase family protein [Alphaproteobacteria bacterium]MCL2890231.1 arginase family protein [Alphaproteobacteria bacterium]